MPGPNSPRPITTALEDRIRQAFEDGSDQATIVATDEGIQITFTRPLRHGRGGGDALVLECMLEFVRDLGRQGGRASVYTERGDLVVTILVPQMSVAMILETRALRSLRALEP